MLTASVQPIGLKDIKQKLMPGGEAEFFNVCGSLQRFGTDSNS
jgi:hypothetical protein